MKQKRKIKQNIWGNWVGYVGRYRVETWRREIDAREWEKNEDDITYENGVRIDPNPILKNGVLIIHNRVY